MKSRGWLACALMHAFSLTLITTYGLVAELVA
jgi:hypothetical protein